MPSPTGWLALISIAILPTVVAIWMLRQPEIAVRVVAALPLAVSSALPLTGPAEPSLPLSVFISTLPIIYLLYSIVVTALILRLAWQTGRLYALPATPIEPGVALTPAAVPPHATGWPLSRITIPAALWSGLSVQERTMLIAHERSHLTRRDPEITDLLLTLQSLFWVNPGLRWLVAGWRQAAEIQADRAATADHDPRAYAQMFARLVRTPHGLPVPTSTPPYPSGDFAMRLDAILNSRPARPRLFIALILAALGSGTVALAANTDNTATGDYPKLVTNVPPVMPMHCLIDEAGAPTPLLTEAAQASPQGRILLENGVANVGWVNIRYDVAADGKTRNISIIKSKADCFHTASVTSVAQWQFETGKPVQGMETQLRFVMQFDAGEDYLGALRGLRDQKQRAAADKSLNKPNR